MVWIHSQADGVALASPPRLIFCVLCLPGAVIGHCVWVRPCSGCELESCMHFQVLWRCARAFCLLATATLSADTAVVFLVSHQNGDHSSPPGCLPHHSQVSLAFLPPLVLFFCSSLSGRRQTLQSAACERETPLISRLCAEIRTRCLRSLTTTQNTCLILKSTFNLLLYFLP